MLATVTGQAHDLRRPRPLGQPGYVLRQLWMQAAELAEDSLANDLRARLLSQPGVGLVPRWTTRRASRALSGELGRHDGGVLAVAVLPDGRVVSGGDDGRVLVWDPAAPEAGPVELGRHDGDGVCGGGAAGRARGQRRRRRAGAGVGPGRARRPTRPSSAATTAGWRRWRCCRTGAWSAAAATGGCWCGTRPRPRPSRSSSAATTAG